MSEELPTGLRERRRRETAAEIHRATLDLFESEGWERATVAEIATRAGVSPRTFFRYFESKEQAVLPGQHRLAEAVTVFTPSELTIAGAATSLRAMLRDVALVDGSDEEIDDHRRIARLMQAQPHLVAVAAMWEATYVQRLQERLIALMPDEPPVTLRAVAETAMVTWRTAWWHWGAELSTDSSASPDDSFAAAERAMTAISAVGER